MHLRLLVCALEEEDWAKVARNVLQLLKPGGYIQWEEGNLVDLRSVYRSGSASALGSGVAEASGTSGLKNAVARTLQLQMYRMVHGWSTLGQVLPEVGFEDVQAETVASDRLPELRPSMCEVVVGACKGILMTCAEKGLEGAPPADDVQRIYERAIEDIKGGAYATFDIWVWVGRRPVT